MSKGKTNNKIRLEDNQEIVTIEQGVLNSYGKHVKTYSMRKMGTTFINRWGNLV